MVASGASSALVDWSTGRECAPATRRVVWRAAVVLRRDPGPPSLLAAAGLAVLTMQLAYYVPYGSDHWQHALLGLLAAFGATRHRQIDRPQREAARQVPLAQRIVA